MCVCFVLFRKSICFGTSTGHYMLSVLLLATFVCWLVWLMGLFSLVLILIRILILYINEAMPRHEKKSIFTTSTHHSHTMVYVPITKLQQQQSSSSKVYCTEYRPPTNYVTPNNQFGLKALPVRCFSCYNRATKRKNLEEFASNKKCSRSVRENEFSSPFFFCEMQRHASKLNFLRKWLNVMASI